MPNLPFAQNTSDARRSLARSARLVALALLSLVLLTGAPKTEAAITEIDDAKAFVANNVLLKELGTNIADGLTGSRGTYKTTVGEVTVTIVKVRPSTWVAAVSSSSLKGALESKLGGTITPVIIIANRSSSASLRQFPSLPSPVYWDSGANVYGTISTDGPSFAALNAFDLLPSGPTKFHGNFDVALFKQIMSASAPSADWSASLKITAGAWNNSSLPITTGGVTATISMRGGSTSSSTVSGAFTNVTVRGIPGTLKSASIAATAGKKSQLKVGLDGIFGADFPLKNVEFVHDGGVTPRSSLTASFTADGRTFNVVGTLNGDTVSFVATVESDWSKPFGIPKVTLKSGSSLSFAIGTAALDIGFDGSGEGGLLINGTRATGSVCGKFGAAGLIGLGFDLPNVSLSASDTLEMVGKIAAKSKASASFVNWTKDASTVPLPSLTGAHVALHTADLGCSQYADKPGVGGTIKGAGNFNGYALGTVDLNFALNGDSNDGFKLVGSTPSLQLGNGVVNVSALNFSADVPLSPTSEKPLDGKVKFSGSATFPNWGSSGVAISGALSAALAEFDVAAKGGPGTIQLKAKIRKADSSGSFSATLSSEDLAHIKSSLVANLGPEQATRVASNLPARNALNVAIERYARSAQEYFLKICSLPRPGGGALLTPTQLAACERTISTTSEQTRRNFAGYADWIVAAAVFTEAELKYSLGAAHHALWNAFSSGLDLFKVKQVTVTGQFNKTATSATMNAALEFKEKPFSVSFTLSPSGSSSDGMPALANSIESSGSASAPPKPWLVGKETSTVIQEIYPQTATNGNAGTRRILQFNVKTSDPVYCNDEGTMRPQQPNGTVYLYKSKFESLDEIEAQAQAGIMPKKIGTVSIDDGVGRLNHWYPEIENLYYSLDGMTSAAEGPDLGELLLGTWYIHAIYFGGPSGCGAGDPANDGYKYSTTSFRWVSGRSDDVGEFTPEPVSPWGTWQKTAYCPANSWAVQFQQRNEAPRGKGDDTALNSVKLYCRQRGSDTLIGPVISHNGYWGEDAKSPYCRQGKWLTSAKISAESSSASDDTASNDTVFRCSDDNELRSEYGGNTWGSWGDWGFCPADTAICGISVKMEGDQASDDTAMNGMRLRCCALPK